MDPLLTRYISIQVFYLIIMLILTDEETWSGFALCWRATGQYLHSPHQQMNRLESLFMSTPNILISVKSPQSSTFKHLTGRLWTDQTCVCALRKTDWIFLFHSFQCFMHFFCGMFSLFIRLWSTRLCFADTAKQNDLSYKSVQIKASEVWFISGD